jgi:hypothetical protein
MPLTYLTSMNTMHVQKLTRWFATVEQRAWKETKSKGFTSSGCAPQCAYKQKAAPVALGKPTFLSPSNTYHFQSIMCPQSNKGYPDSKRVEHAGSTHSGSGIPPNQSPNSNGAHQGEDSPYDGLLRHEEQDFRAMGAWALIDNSPEPQKYEENREAISSNVHRSDY